MVISDNVIIQLKNIPPAELEARGVIVPARTKANGNLTYICPNCGNGNGDSGDGIAFEYKDGAWLAKCFKCGEGYDNIKLLALHYGLNVQTDFVDICNRAAADFGIATDNAAPPKFAPPKVEETALDDKELELIQADIASAAKNIENLPFDCRRGLSIDTLKKFNCGFIENWKSPKSRVADTFATPTPRLIVPSGNHYLARLTVPVETFPADVQKYIRPKQHAGKKALFGAMTITNKTEIIYVFEGEIDAMSSWQACENFRAEFNFQPICAFVATCGVAEQKWLAEVDNICKGFNIKPRFKIFFDNDDAGKDWAIKHRAELLKRGYLAISKTFADYDKDKFDANYILTEIAEVVLASKIFSDCGDEELFAAAQNEINDFEKAMLAEKAAADKAAKEKDILQKMFTLPFSDMYNADRILLLFPNDFRLNRDSEKWLTYEVNEYGGGVWIPLTKSDSNLYPFARKTAEFIDKNRPKFHYKKNSSGGLTLDNSKKQPADSGSVKFGETLARKWQTTKNWNNAISALKGVKEVIIRQEDLDKNPMLLNVKNGVIDLETGKLYPAAPKLLLSKQANVIFNPAARAPVFEKFIQDILPDEMTRCAVLRYLGYCLTGRVDEEKVLFVKGEGGNGKGTLFDTVAYFLGGYATAFEVELILRQKNHKSPHSASPELAKLDGIRFAYAPEIPSGREFDLAVFKQLTGKDTIPARDLFKNSFNLIPTFKLIFSGQHLPKVENPNSIAFQRRFLPVDFNQIFVGGKADINLKDKLRSADELSGIFNILLAECQAWQVEGLLEESSEMKATRTEYIQDNDFIAKFIEEYCEINPNKSAYKNEFYNSLKKAFPVAKRFSDTELKSMIEKIDGVSYCKKVGHNKTGGFKGIRLLDSEEQGDLGEGF